MTILRVVTLSAGGVNQRPYHYFFTQLVVELNCFGCADNMDNDTDSFHYLQCLKKKRIDIFKFGTYQSQRERGILNDKFQKM